MLIVRVVRNTSARHRKVVAGSVLVSISAKFEGEEAVGRASFPLSQALAAIGDSVEALPARARQVCPTGNFARAPNSFCPWFRTLRASMHQDGRLPPGRYV